MEHWINGVMTKLKRYEPYLLLQYSIISFRKMVSAAGFAPAIARSQAESVGSYATRGLPRRFGRGQGLGFCGDETFRSLERGSVEEGGPEGICTLNPPADNGALCSLSYESEIVGSAGNAPT